MLPPMSDLTRAIAAPNLSAIRKVLALFNHGTSIPLMLKQALNLGA